MGRGAAGGTAATSAEKRVSMVAGGVGGWFREAGWPRTGMRTVDYIEGGWPGANPTDNAFFAALPKTKATITAFGMTKRAGRSAENDDVLAAVLNAGTSSVCLVGKTHDFHVETALGISLAENIDAIRLSIAHIVAQGREAIFDAEHFFDGYKSNPAFALESLKAALGEFAAQRRGSQRS